MSLLERANAVRTGDDGSRVARYASATGRRNVYELLAIIESIYNIKDLDTLLDRVLLEARRFVFADAGTLYLKSDDRLYFNYVQNDTLFGGSEADRNPLVNQYTYSQQSVSVDRNSLAGYVAATGESLLIDDVYHIRSGVTFAFNPAFDERSSYKTQSMLIVPLKNREDAVIGVLQLINAKLENGQIVPFSEQDRLFIIQFARSAANTIEQARLSQEMVLRMVELAELRDPFETSAHAKRVGAYAVEIYSRWAERHGVSEGEIQDTREILRTAAMLHDVGKVAVSDVILKKPGELTESEQGRIRLHTIYGARLFKHERSAWDRMAADVVLNHHERWDGRGYPGKIEDIYADDIHFGPGKRGGEIPLAARIVAIADVYDALASERAYKEAWEDEIVLEYIANESARQFDPELVEVFLGMQDVVRSIRTKFTV